MDTLQCFFDTDHIKFLENLTFRILEIELYIKKIEIRPKMLLQNVQNSKENDVKRREMAKNSACGGLERRKLPKH